MVSKARPNSDASKNNRVPDQTSHLVKATKEKAKHTVPMPAVWLLAVKNDNGNPTTSSLRSLLEDSLLPASTRLR
jgi:hypothetical protein